MGKKQDNFIDYFNTKFDKKFGENTRTEQKQGKNSKNSLCFKHIDKSLRRDSNNLKNENFEIGDLRFSFKNFEIIVEYDNDGISTTNLIKFWPFLTGDLKKSPDKKIIFCHFSCWRSYGAYRDLWNWINEKIQKDNSKKIKFFACQFDNGNIKIDGKVIKNPDISNSSLDMQIEKCLKWIHEIIESEK